jgi:hypothetical protein
VLQPDKTVKKRKVTRGPSTPTITSITQGLSPGEKVITEGGDRLTEGAKVTLPGDRPSMMLACAADMKKLCDGKQGREGFMCLRENQAKASAPCKAAMSAAAAARAGGGGSGGSGGGDTAGGYGGGQSGGGFTPSPEMLAARAAMKQACAADNQKLCPGLEGRELTMCIRQNDAKLSAGCKAAVAKMPRRTPSPDGGAPAGGGQPAAAPAAGGGGGGFTPSPEFAAARQAMMQACSGDMKKLCPGQEGREAFMCLRQNTDKASGACKDAMAKMPHRPQPPAGG